MEAIRTVVVDDEPEAREGILSLLRHDGEIAVVGECDTGPRAVATLEQASPELAFLDIQMPGLDGIGVARSIGFDRLPVTVFVTAHEEYALRAFEAHAFDYLLKPFSDERFADALGRAKALVRQRRAAQLSQQLAALFQDTPECAAHAPTPAVRAPQDVASSASAAVPAYAERVPVRNGRRVTFVRVEEIDWIEADGYYAKLHVAGHAHLIRETMQQLAARLDPRRFVRVHRSAIVNIDRVRALHPHLDGKHVVTLRGGTQVAMSRSRREAFERALGWQA